MKPGPRNVAPEVGVLLVVDAANQVNALALKRVLRFPERGGLLCNQNESSWVSRSPRESDGRSS
jgi:hypothetical protein